MFMELFRVKIGLFPLVICKNSSESKIVPGECVVVKKDGKEFLGRVMGIGNFEIENPDLIPEILRRATEEDIKKNESHKERAQEVFEKCKEKAEAHGLEMKLIETEVSLDGRKAIFYFVAPHRVDFRQLIRELARELKMTIEMRQVGVRDATKIKGGIGPCGLELCCKRFILDFQSISLKMAREQGLKTNPQKISGICGRLMCCLGYEYSIYVEKRRKLPSEGTTVETPHGEGVIVEVHPLTESFTIRLKEGGEMRFSSDSVWVKDRPKIFYLTTPIYYVNDVPHIGHAYTTIAADVIARFHRLMGERVFFLTGTDEHGRKIEKQAEEMGLKPKELVDRVVERYKELWKLLNISNDDFIRTTEERHRRAVIEIWNRIKRAGDLYIGDYEDWYCVPCESFWNEKELVDGKCPSCGRPVEKLREKTYYFRLSKYQGRLLRFYEENPEFVKPDWRMNEVVSFVKGGLRDLSVSRVGVKWGIKVPDDEEHTIYVWFDALTNYLTAAGFPDSESFNSIWPADVHIIGKDILRFHAIYWPAFLLSADLPLPKHIFAHGWWTVDGKKMSKSAGNVIDPKEICEKYGVDQFRFFLFREVPFGLDGDFSMKAFVERVNSDLANNLGNLVKRTLDMSWKYFSGKCRKPVEIGDYENRLKGKFQTIVSAYISAMSNFELHRALQNALEMLNELNKYLDETSPWKLWKNSKNKKKVNTILSVVLSYLRFTALLLYPFMPESAQRMWKMLGMEETEIEDINLNEMLKREYLEPDAETGKGEVLFSRIGL